MGIKVLYEEEKEFLGKKVFLQLVEYDCSRNTGNYKTRKVIARIKKEKTKWILPKEVRK